MNRRKSFFAVALMLMAVFALGGAVHAQAAQVKVAIIMPSTINDGSWSQAIFDSLKSIQTEMGGESAMAITYTENMFDVTAAAEAARGYAEDGNDLVILHGSQFGDALFDLAKDYPTTSFAWGTASDTGKAKGVTNVFAYDIAAQQGGYINGVMAAMLTKSKKIGIVGPIPAGDAILYNNGFLQGVHATDPSVAVQVAYTGGFGDTAKAAEVAKTEIAAGADVLTGSAQQVPGAIDAIKTAGGHWFSTDTDMSAQWPDTVVASMAYDFSGVIKDMLAKHAAGTMGDVAYMMTLTNGGIKMAYNETVPGATPEIFDAGKAADTAVASNAIYPVSTLSDKKIRVAVVMPSAATDLAWSQSIVDGLKAIQKQLGGEDAMEIALTEGQFDVAAAGDSLRSYADDGYDIIIAHGTQYGDVMFDVAKDYPNTSFAWGTATDVGTDKGLSNVFAYQADAEQGGYVEGVMAAMMSKAGKIGIVGPVAAGDALLYINGFQQGVVATKPDAQILLAYTGSFGDTAKAAEVAKTQIAAGADVLTGSAQQVPGAIDAIKAAGGFWFGTQSDQSGNWPETVVASQVYNWAPTIGQIIESRLAGKLGGSAYTLTLANGGLKIVYGGAAVSDDVKAAADKAIAGVTDGSITVDGNMSEATEMPPAAEATP
jgi:basic membrane protein A